MTHVLSLDISTNSLKVAVIDKNGEVLAISELVLDSIYREHGWCEQRPELIFETILDLIENCLLQHSIDPKTIAAIALTNLKGPITAFNRETGELVENFITNNDTRVNPILKKISTQNNCDLVRQKAGLSLSRSLGALKMRWILDNCDEAKRLSKKGQLAFASLESFMIHRLTSKKSFVTDITNAVSTGLVNSSTLDYDQELLDLFAIDRKCLATIQDTDTISEPVELKFFSNTIRVLSSLCKSQSSALASGSLSSSEIKCSFSSNCTILLQLNKTSAPPSKHFETILSQKFKDQEPIFGVEASISHVGSVVKWLQDSMGLIHTPRELEALAYSVPDSGGVFFVPTFSGIGAPLWDQSLQGTILGIKESTNIGHIARASLEGIAYQIAQNIQAMLTEFNLEAKSIRCGGKMAKDSFLMQMIADLSGLRVICAKSCETALIGTALCAHVGLKNIQSIEEFATLFQHDTIFDPKMEKKKAQMMLDNWQIALEATKDWSNKVA
jgi:glycerol kinase